MKFKSGQRVRFNSKKIALGGGFHDGGVYVVTSVNGEECHEYYHDGKCYPTVYVERDDFGLTNNGHSAFFFEPLVETPFQRSVREYLESEL